MANFDLIKKNVATVRARMARASEAAGRSPDSVQLCAVTKYVGAEEIRALRGAGVSLIGENRVQDAERKINELQGRDFTLHMIGHLQSNKADKAAALFDAVQSLDSLKLARRLDAEAAKRNKRLEVYLQVNSSGEETKSGFTPEAFMSAAEDILELKNLDVTGVMTIGPLTGDEKKIEEAFTLTRELYDKLAEAHAGVKHLSMGMTDDLEIAIGRGATQVRVGRALYHG